MRSLWLAGLGVAVAVIVGAGFVVAARGPSDPTAPSGVHGSGAPESVERPGGLTASRNGYTLLLERTAVKAGRRSISFTIEGPDGSPVTDYEIEHEKELHLIAARRDLPGFQHVHPRRDASGTWRASLDLAPGTWRVFADFAPAPVEGHESGPLALGADLVVHGDPGSAEVVGSRTSRIDSVDGYRVELIGDLVAGQENDVSFAVTRDGEPVAQLQPYLGARGHLVALRASDLAYLHVHPTHEQSTDTHEVGFSATVPSPDSYRLYLDFRHDGVVRTASFVLPALPPPGEGAGTTEDEHAH